jgi:hypothetical protein
MKYIIAFLIFMTISNHGIGQIEEYVDFLQKPHFSAKNYILKQFEEHDMVILCERDHNELTQYDLFLDVIADPWFVENASNIFTEIGSYSNRERINDFIHTIYDNDSTREADLITCCQNVNFYASWDIYNYYYFLDQINIINSDTGTCSKISLFPSDHKFNWDEIESTDDYLYWLRNVDWVVNRDSMMAKHIIEQYEEQVKLYGNKKCLVILNNRHAFARFVRNAERDLIVPNTAAILMDKYKERATNILIHNMGASQTLVDDKPWNYEYLPTPIHQGKWDAAFKTLGYESKGFDLDGSPFGEDNFDFWPFDKTELKYKDYFDGYVYFLSVEKFKPVEGIPNYFKYNDFKNELVRRSKIFNEAYGRANPDPSWYDRDDKLRIYPVYGITKYREAMNRWLK